MMKILRLDLKAAGKGILMAGMAALGIAAPVGAVAVANPFAVVNRTIVQDQGNWQVNYRLRYAGAMPLIVTAEDVLVRVESWVSNSRIPGHATPRWSSQTFSGPSGLHGVADVIATDDEERRCRERAAVRIWVEDDAGGPARRVLASDDDKGGEPSASTLSLSPGMTFRVELRLEHRHVVYGTYDPLLGLRALELSLGAARFSDTLPLDREQRIAFPPRASFEVPEDRRDTQYVLSAPDSLHLAAHIPGNAFFRFPEIPVRYGTKMRLKFSYLIAAGTEGTCRARITQYKDSPIAWKVLADGRREESLTAIGRWTQVTLVFRTEPEATTLALDFRIEGAEVEAGELWIDDVSLEPVGAAPVDP
jgi:hypothetical protein